MADHTESLREALVHRYLLEREVGRGPMSTVYAAWDVRHQRRVALKVLNPDLAAALGPDRFLREIEICAGLQHPHIVPLFDSGSVGSFLYYVMPLVEGESLAQRLGREPQLPVEDALRIARQVAEALAYAHERHVVHRDIKPDNILLQNDHALVVDFGVARAVGVAGATKMTQTGTTIGTPLYMSPEQAWGGERLDGRSDIYSLGCVLFEMLAGEPPFSGPTAESIIRKHISQEAPRVSTPRPAVPPGIDHIVLRCMAKSPADRFRTAHHLVEALVAPEKVAPPRRGASRRRAQRVVAAAVVLVGLGMLAMWTPGLLSRVRRPPEEAPAPLKSWIMLADFDGPADDPTLAVAVRDLVSGALEQSDIVFPVPREQIEHQLERLGKPPGTRLDSKLARELASRGGVRAVVEGRIGRIGRGYTIAVRVLDMDNTLVVVSVTDVARDQEALIGTVARIARRLRVSLGEKKSSVQATSVWSLLFPGEFFGTAKFESMRKAGEADSLASEVGPRAAIPLWRQAVAIDPGNSSAWFFMGMTYGNLGLQDSAQMAFKQAYKHPERIHWVTRLFYEAWTAADSGNYEHALAIYDRILRKRPNSPGTPVNRAALLMSLGRFEEALVDCDRAKRANPFGPDPGEIDSNEFEALVSLGRLNEARELLPKALPAYAQSFPLGLALAADNWAAAESLGSRLEGNPNFNFREEGMASVAFARAARGALQDAARTLLRAEQVAREEQNPIDAEQLRRSLLLLSWASGSAIGISVLEEGRDSTMEALITRGLRAAVDGDLQKARDFMRNVRSRPHRELLRHGECPALLEAWIATREGRWKRVVDLLGEAANRGVEPGTIPDPAGRPALRWLVAEAYEHLQRPDSAARYYELAISPLGRLDQGLRSRGIIYSLALQRLVLLELKMGHFEAARRRWDLLVRTCTRPDEAMRPFLDEARAALKGVESVAGRAPP